MSNSEIQISVIIPTYERAEFLKRLLDKLTISSFKNFEVVIIDQSRSSFEIRKYSQIMKIQYHHVSFRGAALARNYGAKLAKGDIIAFIDDDCIPNNEWLANAYHCFSKNDIVGVEGRVYPDKTNPKKYRIVSNIGREGYAFLTANLFVLRDCFNKLDGFDERFNEPHFREDTDFGWRLQQSGEVLFSEQVSVLHPSEIKKSSNNRVHFFEQDALLFAKHPVRYIQLFALEEHYINTSGFWEYFISGFKRHQVSYSLINGILNSESINLGYIPLPEVLALVNA